MAKSIATTRSSPLPPETEDSESFRAAPHNIDAEQALLGAILVNNEAQDRVSTFLRAEHFFDPLHASIYETAGKLIAAGKQATPITLRTYFETAEPIDQNLTVPQYLGRLAANATTIINAVEYARTIYDLAVRRQLILIGEDMVNVAYDSPIDTPPETQIQEAETRLFSLAETGKYGQGFLTFENALTHAIEMANSAYQRQGGLSGVSTGLRDLDARMGGLQSSDLIILAGRPSMGKTSLATNIAYNIAKAQEFSPSRPRYRRRRSVAGKSRTRSSGGSFWRRRRWRAVLSTSIRRVASPSPSSRHAPGS